MKTTSSSCLSAALLIVVASESLGDTISTFDATEVTAFQSGRTVIDFDEIVVPDPFYLSLNPSQYAALGIEIRANDDGSAQTHVAKLPELGLFGPTHTAPNIIGGGVSGVGVEWRQTIRFDFPGLPADAIGAHTDSTGSNTTLTAFLADGTVITSVSGDQGSFMGIQEPNIAYALWEWNFDQATNGFSLDNVTFSLVPEPSTVLLVASGLIGLAINGRRRRA